MACGACRHDIEELNLKTPEEVSQEIDGWVETIYDRRGKLPKVWQRKIADWLPHFARQELRSAIMLAIELSKANMTHEMV